MVPKLFNEDHTIQYGSLYNCINCVTTEERNGTFMLVLTYPITDTLHTQLVYGNIIECRANDEQNNQLFRIFSTDRIIRGTVTVTALHISFDLTYDYIRNIDLKEVNCQSALNTIFQSSEFCKHYTGISDIEPVQNYAISDCNASEAICGTQGSIIDTFGLGAEIKRDNTTISVLKDRGSNNGVTIQYGVNMLEESLLVDTTELTTIIYPYATTYDDNANTIEIRGDKVISPLVNDYAHPFIAFRDYTEFFIEGGPPTKESLEALARKEFEDSKVDVPKCSYTVNFVPLSKCIGYDNIQDAIHLCDTVTIIDSRYNINTQAKVIKYTYDVLKEMYETMELGDPKTSLHDLMQSATQGEKGEKGESGNLSDFPDTLPNVPNVRVTEGNGSLFVQWSYVNAIYYTYELYGSTTSGFVPNSSNLIYSGQSSSYTYNVSPDTRWYFRVRVVNTHDNATEFSTEVYGTAKKLDTGSITIGEDDIKDYMVDKLSLAREWNDLLNSNYINFTDTYIQDERTRVTFGVDDRNEITLRGKVIQLFEDNQYKDVATRDYLDAAIDLKFEDYNTDVSGLETRMSNVETYVNNTVTNLNATTKELTDTVNASAAQVEQNKTAIATNTSVLNEHTQKITALEEQQNDLTSLEEQVATNTENILTNHNDITTINKTILDLTSLVLELQNRIIVLEGGTVEPEPEEPVDPEVPEEGGEDNEGDIEE